ncbi:YnfU family zinc-binding protein [Serratia marcescens]|uniref:YnfU family zinc-binding protein n=1 Tax=Serratia TaxID=613 RepID=UPI0028935C36|nr:YnfU family zinc-binding protein [Serratia marcescens]
MNYRELLPLLRSIVITHASYPVKDMSIFDALKMFSDSSVKVACPKCSYVTEQSSQKLRKNITLICPECGHYFLPEEE